MTEFKFKPKDGSSFAKALTTDCPSPALLLAALIDGHGWTLFSASNGGQQQFVLQKAPDGA